MNKLPITGAPTLSLPPQKRRKAELFMARRELLFGGTRRALGLALLTGVGAALSACGQRGPLYLPDPKDPTKKRS